MTRCDVMRCVDMECNARYDDTRTVAYGTYNYSNVGKTIINHPFGNGFMVIRGMVYYCFTYIIRYSYSWAFFEPRFTSRAPHCIITWKSPGLSDGLWHDALKHQGTEDGTVRYQDICGFWTSHHEQIDHFPNGTPIFFFVFFAAFFFCTYCYFPRPCKRLPQGIDHSS